MGGGISKAMRTKGLVVDQGFHSSRSVRTQPKPKEVAGPKISKQKERTYHGGDDPFNTDMHGNRKDGG